ncbi:MAG: LCCL domain-containing protein [Planctomycetota bacterium]
MCDSQNEFPKTTSPLRFRRRHVSLWATVMVAGFMLGGRAAQAAELSSETNQRPIPEIKWDTTLRKFLFDREKFIGQRLTVNCPPASPNQDLSGVFGTGNYPSESSICVAAMHAGVITKDGGPVTIQLNPGLTEYIGSESHGVSTGTLPGTEFSMAFVTNENREENDRIRLEYLPRIDWNTKFTSTGLAYRDLVGQRFTFRVPSAPVDRRMRIVYGTDHYDFSSNLPVAALHAGVITKEGGLITVQLDYGKGKLVGSIRNGVETKSKNGRDRSLSFVTVETSK